MLKSQRKYNKFGRSEHANCAVGDDDDGALVDLNLMSIVFDQGDDEDSWCEVLARKG